MASFFSGMIKGGILSAVALGTASVLLPARPKLPPTDIAQSTPQTTEAVIVDEPQMEVAQPAAPADIGVISDAAKSAEPTPVIAPAEDAEPKADAKNTALAKEALLDPIPDTLAAAPIASGAKTIAAPKKDEQAEIGSESIFATSQAIADAAALQAVEPVAINGTPLQKFAAQFDNFGTKPLFAVILRDTGARDLDRAALAALPFPVTFAIDPEAENATEAMAIYRAAGKEVVMLTAGLPDGATAQDLEQSFQTYDTILPETVAVMGPAKGGFQDNAVLSKLIVPVIAGQGRGLITFDRGLNSAAQNAAREGLVSATVFRQVDGGGETVSVIRRYLDRAVFKAAQDGAAIVMGETLPDTITALAEWSLEGRATEVTLAPVSAILR